MDLTGPVRRLSLATAQRLAIQKQGLGCHPDAPDRQALLDIIRKIRLLQLDTIHVVARSHYLVMLSRAGLYDPRDLDALLYPDRMLFEQWAHAACLIPIEDYPYLAPVVWERRAHSSRRRGRLGPSSQEILDAVVGRIAAAGPLRSVDFEDTRESPGTWWDWKPAKIALEILFEEGYLMIDRRENFQRFYDLAERVIPASGAEPSLAMDDWRRWACLRGARCLGVATMRQIADYYRQGKGPVKLAVDGLVAEGVLVPAEVEGWKEPAYVAVEDLPLVDAIDAGGCQPALTTFLSPFDNLIWDRQRAHDLFGFDYRIEVYTPLATKQRKYGYYVMPILWNGQLIGRLDPKADRKNKILLVHAVYLEPGVEATGELIADVAAALREFAEFHGCDTVRITRCEPAALNDPLQKACG